MDRTVDEKCDQYIYHYTSLEAFQTILKNYRDSKDKDNIIFWASNIRYMNDPTEMMIGYKALMNYLPSIEDNIPNEKKLSSLSTQYHVIGQSDEDTQHYFNEISFVKELSPFILSFSSEASSIPMWHIYGKGGHGVCLYFEKKTLEKALNSKDGILLSLDYEYDLHKSIYYKPFSKEIEEYYLDYLKDVEGKPTDNGYLQEKISVVRKMCTYLSPYLKNHLFKFENEIRYIHHTMDKELIKYRYSAKRRIIPYIEIHIPVNTLYGIEIGPCSDLRLQKENLQEDLNVTFPNRTIKIIHSDVPLRDM